LKHHPPSGTVVKNERVMKISKSSKHRK